MIQPGSAQPQRLRNFLDWLTVRYSMIIVVPLLLIGGYHIMWALGGSRYDPIAAAVVAGIAVAIAGVMVLARALGISRSAGIKAFLVLAGLGGAGSAIMLYLGQSRMDLNGATKTISIATLLVGVLILVAAATLRQDTESAVHHPKFVEQRDVPLPGANGTAQVRTFRGYGGRGIDRILAAAESQISTEDLHYVAYHVDGLCVFSIDVLDDASLPAEDKVTSDQRRTQYLLHGLKLNRLMVGLNEEFRTIDSGILLRVVLDVERGALYYFWVDESRFLIGVTVNQSQVHKADSKMVHIVDAVRPLLGHKRIEDLNR